MTFNPWAAARRVHPAALQSSLSPVMRLTQVTNTCAVLLLLRCVPQEDLQQLIQQGLTIIEGKVFADGPPDLLTQRV